MLWTRCAVIPLLSLLGLAVPVSAVPPPEYGPDTPGYDAIKEGKRPKKNVRTDDFFQPETTWFGGTSWDAVDQRWEAVKDSVWTFESGVGSIINADSLLKPLGLHALMEGWTGDSRLIRDEGEFRRLHRSAFADTVCVGSETGVLGGEWSLWAGLTAADADTACYVEGQGYGNSWNVTVAQTFSYTGGNVDLSFAYAAEMEDGFDFVEVRVDTGGTGWFPLAWSVTGVASGNAQVTLVPGETLPSTPRDVTFTIEVNTDGAWSDEDGIFGTTCGAFGIDDIVMTGGILHNADFETSDDGWVRHHPVWTQFSADWSTLRATADLPDESGFAGCTLGDSVLTFYDEDPDPWFHNCHKDVVAVSPWIDLVETEMFGSQGRAIEIGGFFNTNISGYVYLQVEAQWYPEVCEISGIPSLSDFTSTGSVYYLPLATCAPTSALHLDFSAIVPDYAEQLRFAVGVISYASFWLCDVPLTTSSTPWIDNIRMGIFDGPTLSVQIPGETTTPTSPLGPLSPNPYRGTGLARVNLTPEAKAHAVLQVFDIRGRLVRTLFDGVTGIGPFEIFWDGRDNAGRPVKNGVYFYRLVTAGESYSNRLVVLRN
jgi:hypothetical protein